MVLVAKRLPYADNIISLGPKGETVEQGAFADLNISGGYVSSFHLPRADWTYRPPMEKMDDEVTDVPSRRSEDGRASISSQASSNTACSVKEETEADASRRTGDVQIYLYYVRSVGWVPTLLFTIAIVGFVFCVSFPSKRPFPFTAVLRLRCVRIHVF